MDKPNKSVPGKKGTATKSPKPSKPNKIDVLKSSRPVAIDRKKAALIEALEQTLGVVTAACRKTGVSRTQFYHYMRTDPDFKAAYEDLANVALDFAEAKLHQRIADGSDACTIFYLKTKGKGRGYIERTEITGQNGAAIAIQVVTPDDEMKRAIDEI